VSLSRSPPTYPDRVLLTIAQMRLQHKGHSSDRPTRISEKITKIFYSNLLGIRSVYRIENCKIVSLGAFPIHLFRHSAVECISFIATIHFVTDRQRDRDRQTDDISNIISYCVAVRSAKNSTATIRKVCNLVYLCSTASLGSRSNF